MLYISINTVCFTDDPLIASMPDKANSKEVQRLVISFVFQIIWTIKIVQNMYRSKFNLARLFLEIPYFCVSIRSINETPGIENMFYC